MKNCMNCKYAEWSKTATGKLHPSGDGRCKYPYKVPDLPLSMYWVGNAPTPNGGAINRKQELSGHCAYFLQHEDKV